MASVLPQSMTLPIVNEERQDNGLSTNVLENFCDYAYDFEQNALKLRDGKHYFVYGNEAMKIWIYKATITARFRYSAYSDRFGSEIFDLVGEVISNKLKKEEIKRYILEAIMVHPYMVAVKDIQLRPAKDGLEAHVWYQTVFIDDIEEVKCTVPMN